MMKRALIPLLLTLAACDPSPPPQPETATPSGPMFETQTQALEKARAAGDTLRDAAAARAAESDGVQGQ